MVQIAPSLLSADFSALASEVGEVETGGADLLHLDVMDGNFVPNITFGPPLVRAVEAVTELTLDAHLMIADPAAYIPAFAEAGADIISFHVEAAHDAGALIDQVLECGARPSMALNPDTNLHRVKPHLDRLAMVLVMSVYPGFGGQRFIAEVLDKIRELRDLGFTGEIEVDGGITEETAPLAAEAGATVLVAGTSVFGQKDRAAAIAGLRRAAQSALETAEG